MGDDLELGGLTMRTFDFIGTCCDICFVLKFDRAT